MHYRKLEKICSLSSFIDGVWCHSLLVTASNFSAVKHVYAFIAMLEKSMTEILQLLGDVIICLDEITKFVLNWGLFTLCRQISLDCMFLESQCIMDYSMLLGLHFRAPEHLKTPLEFQETLENSPSLSADDCIYLIFYASICSGRLHFL